MEKDNSVKISKEKQSMMSDKELCDCHIFYEIKENSEDIDDDIVDMVNEEFWNLI